MKNLKYFWILFVLYFVFAHPAIIYYNIPRNNIADENPIIALLLLAIAVIGWTIVLVILARSIYKNTYGQRTNISKILQSGRSVVGTVISSKTLPSNDDRYVPKEVTVEFNNFAKQTVRYTLTINDSQPQLRRYELDKKLRLCIDEQLRYPPYILPEDIQAKLHPGRIATLYILWGLFVFAIIGYFLYAYKTENNGYGWRFLVAYHPLLLSLYMIALFGFIGYMIKGGWYNRAARGSKGMKLLLFGNKTNATVLSATQTGTYINNQPEVKFNLSFMDTKGRTHQTSIKKIVNLLNLSYIHKETKTILYLPEEPEVIAFEEDIE